MKTSETNNLNAACTVSEMARRLNLSRARFYQLMKIGVFPRPVYSIHTNRPFYPLDLQQKCITIRKTGVGLDQRPVLFNAPRTTDPSIPQNQTESRYRLLSERLKQLGLTVSPKQIKKAFKILYPSGLTENRSEGAVIGDLVRYLNGNRHISV